MKVHLVRLIKSPAIIGMTVQHKNKERYGIVKEAYGQVRYSNEVAVKRATFYKHCTMAMHVRNYHWHVGTTVKIKGKLVADCDRELIRALRITHYAKCYLPMDLVEPVVRDN